MRQFKDTQMKDCSDLRTEPADCGACPIWEELNDGEECRMSRLIRARKEINEQITEEINRIFYPGKQVTYEKWGGVNPAEILSISAWSGRGRFCVENEKSGKKVWITLYDLTGIFY